MSTEFKQEERYIVFKQTDLGNSLKGDEIRQLAREYAEQRRLRGKPPLECVVVEKDWPEYEPTWQAIEARVTGCQAMTERERFESWARQRWTHPEDFDQRIKAPSKYNNYEVQAAWEAWQERAAQPSPRSNTKD